MSESVNGGKAAITSRRSRWLGPSAVNGVLRLGSLALKFVLSIYLARFASLANLGIYGLAFSSVMITTAFLGLRLDYSMMREIPSRPVDDQARMISAGLTFYWLNYAILALPAWVLVRTIYGDMTPAIFGVVYLLCCTESIANLLYNVTVSLDRNYLAGVTFFLRSAAWVVPVIAVGLAVPAARTAEVVLFAWLAGALVAVVINLRALTRRLAIRWALWPSEAQWRWISASLKPSLGIWAGTLAVAAGSYCDRFFLARFATLSDAGVATFYLSFTIALITLVQSATLLPYQAAIVRRYDSGDLSGYRHQLRRTALATFGMSLVVGLFMAAGVAATATLIGRHELIAHLDAFLVLLGAAVVRAMAEMAYYPLFVERRTRSIWFSNLVYLFCTMGTYAVLIPRRGIEGLAEATLLSATVLLVLRVASALGSGRGPWRKDRTTSRRSA